MLINNMTSMVTTAKLQVEKSVIKINNNGKELNQHTLQRELDLKNQNHTLEVEMTSIKMSLTRNEEYDNVFSNIKDGIKDFKDTYMRKIDDATSEFDQTIMESELKTIVESLKFMLSTQDRNGEYLFSGTKSKTNPFDSNFVFQGNFQSSKLLIGNNQFSNRILNPEPIMNFNGNGSNILQELNRIAETKDTNELDNIEKIFQVVSTMHAEIGAESYSIQKMSDFKNKILTNNNNIINSENKLEESIVEYNKNVLKYEAVMKITAETKDLSLVKYI